MVWSILGVKSNFWIVLTNNLKINSYIQRRQNLSKQLKLISSLTENTLPLNDKGLSINVTYRKKIAYYENSVKEVKLLG
jgi:hypothetical protein